MKILIGAVLAVALLAIVYSVTAQSPPYTGYDALKDLLRQAQNGPGMCFSRGSINFIAGEDFSTFGAGQIIPKADIMQGTSVKTAVTASASVKCTSTSAGSCKIWIGSPNCV